jgi:hypothetical protein
VAKRKKARTPAPPKRPAAPRSNGRRVDGDRRDGARVVQAPQVRSGKRRTQADTDRRNRMILYGVAAAGILGLAIALILVVATRGGGTSKAHDDGPNVNFANLPGLRQGSPPWPANNKNLTQRLKPLGLNPLGQEGQVLHIHEHLDIYDDGKHVSIPKFIGIHFKGQQADYLTELHTHANDGVIHLESLKAQAYSLGQFFGAWGVNLTRNCVGGLCATPAKPLKFYVNGKPFLGNPVKLVLQEHDEYAIVYGKPPSQIPSSYDWPAGE